MSLGKVNEHGKGHSCPIPAQTITTLLQRTDVAAALLATEPKYRKYTQQLDKCLSTFENVQDWADCTAFLTKLLKVRFSWPVNSQKPTVDQILASNTQFKEIPHKLIIAKRLAQCLNPALPTGVHQRALEVYSHILNTIGVCSWPQPGRQS